MHYANITGWGKCLPPAVLTNDDFTQFIETSDEWISSRTGIKERRISHVNTSELAVIAGKRALDAAGLQASDMDMIMLATATPDTLVPNAASNVARQLGAGQVAAMDFNAACTGFVYGLHTATAMIRSGMQKRILLIGAERINYYLDWSKRDTAVLFGDGAGAVVLEASDEECGLLASKLGCDSEARDILSIPGYGTAGNRFAQPAGIFELFFEGQEIFKRAVRGMSEAVGSVMEQARICNDDIDLLIPHQANARIIEMLARKLSAPAEKVVVNIHKYGNTSAATIPIALTEALESGRIKPGDNLMCAAFGAGLTWGAAYLKWGKRVTPIKESDAELPPCDKTALALLDEAIQQCRKHGKGQMLPLE